jgi:hypothetical protein
MSSTVVSLVSSSQSEKSSTFMLSTTDPTSLSVSSNYLVTTMPLSSSLVQTSTSNSITPFSSTVVVETVEPSTLTSTVLTSFFSDFLTTSYEESSSIETISMISSNFTFQTISSEETTSESVFEELVFKCDFDGLSDLKNQCNGGIEININSITTEADLILTNGDDVVNSNPKISLTDVKSICK